MAKDTLVEINVERLRYLLKLYSLSEVELLSILNEDGHKRALTSEDLFSGQIPISLLKRIDKVFNKGIYYYVDFSPIQQEKHTSIFFRKQQFGSPLNLEARKTVDRFETLKRMLDTYSVLADVNFERTLPSYTLNDDARATAKAVREVLAMRNHSDEKSHLKFIINQLAKQNVYVFEYVEATNKKDKSNVEGFFIAPNVIVIKRQQGKLKRELFTLAHELGHCLINEEEVENVSDELSSGLSEIEKWCNDFAFYFLIGDDAEKLDGLLYASAKNDYATDMVKSLSEKSHQDDYALVRGGIMSSVKRAESERKRLQENSDITMSPPRPIISNLFRDTMQCALYRGVIDEATFCHQLNIKPERINAYL